MPKGFQTVLSHFYIYSIIEEIIHVSRILKISQGSH